MTAVKNNGKWGETKESIKTLWRGFGGRRSGSGRQTGSVLVKQEVGDGLRQRQGRDVFETSFAQGPADPDAAQVAQSRRTSWKDRGRGNGKWWVHVRTEPGEKQLCSSWLGKHWPWQEATLSGASVAEMVSQLFSQVTVAAFQNKSRFYELNKEQLPFASVSET